MIEVKVYIDNEDTVPFLYTFDDSVRAKGFIAGLRNGLWVHTIDYHQWYPPHRVYLAEAIDHPEVR